MLSALLHATVALSIAAAAPSNGDAPTPARIGEDGAVGPKALLALQPLRAAETVAVEGAGGLRGRATLVNLNPASNAWFLLLLDWGEPSGAVELHLENPRPRTQHLSLPAGQPEGKAWGLTLEEGGASARCALWGPGPAPALEVAQRLPLPFVPLCGGRLYLRNPVAGASTALEWATDLLRDHVPGGDRIIGFVKRELFQDAFREEPPLLPAELEGAVPPGAPLPPALNPAHAQRAVVPAQLGIELEKPPGPTPLGRWYPARGVAGVFVSVVEPGALLRELRPDGREALPRLDSAEARALVFVVGFDLALFELGYETGTDHPRVDWSDHALPEVRRSGLPGPDGLGTIRPLVSTGMVSPALTARTAATFTGGFKRLHGAFHAGPFAHQNQGSHYGFIVQGVVLSKLVPGLATLYVLVDGEVGLTTWRPEDDRWLGRIRFARQNGVPLLDRDPATGALQPGALVGNWAAGNWSGSEDKDLRTLRAGACIQESAGRRFLLYGYFSSATPPAMARVFLAYHCSAAMHLDMNALEHTYLALYERRAGQMVIEHLMEGMAVVDKKAPRSGRANGGEPLPRFLGFPDDRDFFYLLRRGVGP